MYKYLQKCVSIKMFEIRTNIIGIDTSTLVD